MYICMFLYVGTGMCMMAHGVGGRVHNRTQSLPILTIYLAALPCVHLPSAGITAGCHTYWLSPGFWGSKL